MQSPPHDPASALAIRNQYRQSQSRAARLRLLVDTGQELTHLPPQAMRQRVLQRACAFVAMDHGLLLEWSADNGVQTTASHGSAERLATLETAADPLAIGPQWLERPAADLPCMLLLPLRGADEGSFGTLLLANSVGINAPDGKKTKVQARYSFLYHRVGNEWKILNHHSSAMPEVQPEYQVSR